MENQNSVLINTGWAHIQKGNYDVAIQLLLKARENSESLDKNSLQELSRGLGWAYYHKREYDEAIGYFNTINKNNLSEVPIVLQDVFRGLGWAYYRNRNFNEAIDNFNLALRHIDPGNEDVMKEARQGLDLATQMKKDKGAYDSSFYEAKSLYISTQTPFTELGLPELIEIEPTFMCNLRCIQCHTSYQKIPNTIIDHKFLKHLKGIEGKWIVLGSNYEPMMHPKFSDIVAELSGLGMKIDLITNGSLFTEKISKQLADCNLFNVIISFDGIQKKTYESIRRNANYERTIEGIMYFKNKFGNKKPYFSINNTLMKRNIEEVIDSIDFWERQEFNHCGFIMMVIRNLNETLKQESLENNMNYVYEKLTEAALRVIKNNYKITLSGAAFKNLSELKKQYPNNLVASCVKSDNPQAKTPFNPLEFIQNGYYPGMPVACRSAFKCARILYNGSVELCYQFPIGNIYENDFLDIWYGQKAKNVRMNLKKNPKICQACDYYRLCIKAGELDYNDNDSFYSELVETKGRYPTPVEKFAAYGYHYNIVLWLDDYYALPEDLGNIDILSDSVTELEGVFVNKSLTKLREALKDSVGQMRTDPKSQFALRGRGWSNFHEGDYDAAIQDFLKALQCLHPTEKSYLQAVFRGLGWSYYHKAKYQEALKYFMQILEDNLSDSPIVLQDVLRGVGWSYLRIGHYDTAIQKLLKALPLVQQTDQSALHEVFRGLGWAYYYKRQYDKSAKCFNKVVDNHLSDAPNVLQDVFRGLGWSYFKIGNFQRANDCFDLALKHIDPADGPNVLQDVFRGLGWSYLKIGNFQRANDCFDLALKHIDPANQKIVKETRRGLNLASRMKESEDAHDSIY